MLFIPLKQCGAARMLWVWKCWSCLIAVGVTQCSFGDSMSKPKWSYQAAPPLGRRTQRMCSYLLWRWSWLLLFYQRCHVLSRLQRKKKTKNKDGHVRCAVFQFMPLIFPPYLRHSPCLQSSWKVSLPSYLSSLTGIGQQSREQSHQSLVHPFTKTF